MENEMLELQQYINIHPIKDIDKHLRSAYVSLIDHICRTVDVFDKWSESMIELMIELISDNAQLLSVNIDKNNSIIFSNKQGKRCRYKFYRYRHIILTDCLFISAYNNRAAGEKILDHICKLFPKNRKKSIRLFDLFYQPDLTVIKNEFPELLNIYRIIETNRSFQSKKQKRIMITANMSAGKSTLLNALSGKKVNKTQNDSCTAKLHYLYNKAGEDELSYELDYDLELNAGKKELMEDNKNNTTSEIYVGTRFRSLKEIKNRICFIDTPGVNSSQDKEHREITNDVISDKSCDLLIYLLNGENIGTDDDISHLRYVHENYHGKTIFIVNKLDRFKRGTDSVSDTLKKVTEDLKKIGYKKPKVYPISAYAAYLAKMFMYGEQLTDDELDELEFRNSKLSKDEFQYYRYYDIEAPLINVNNKMEIILKNSGILSLEKIIY